MKTLTQAEGRETSLTSRLPLPATFRAALADGAAMALAVVLLAALFWATGDAALQRVASYAAIMLTAVCGLQIFSGNSGIVSFGHSGFVGLGAYACGILTMPAALQGATLRNLPGILAGHELTLGGALLVIVLFAVLVGALSGGPLLRLSGSGASIATLAILIITYTLLVATRDITRGSQPFYGVPRNVGLWTSAAAAAFALVAARLFRDSPVGLSARAAADDDRGAAAIGVSRRGAWYLAWILSVVLAFVAGALMAQFLGAFSPKDFYFHLSFTMLAMLILGGMTSSLGALAGVVATTILIEIVRRFESGAVLFGVELPSLFGLTDAVLALSMILVIWRRPLGLMDGRELDLLRRFGRGATPPAELPAIARQAPGGEIAAEGVGKRYAGVVAVDGVSLSFAMDMITGIIGPNGAGKTTFLNIISGDVEPSSGTVRIGRSLRGHSAVRFARAGIARTFQNLRIFGRMTVFENVLVAARQVEPDLARAERAAWRELALMGLDEVADRPAATIAYGLRRRLEIARALALGPRFLLLDEPAAGMNAVETADLVQRLAEVRTRRGIGIVLIEHDMRLVMNLCERIVVIDHGQVIADGPPAEVRRNPDVVAAYLGSRSLKAQQDNNQEDSPTEDTSQ
ncbi:ATP-binding cassette domain-containing protein [Poseidonocella sp. HB161398]|uniref:branched-chain amino acid ABC transporter ATP-binding protein/permease n=1 Tax=Poseidonocella sp. HB161398 TaxID=2320855 RepID=UPI0011080692|nr:branched-chain amino acid ABC transporter ATP-binding protein/permease [Poseidonocella sp. HB161398]